MSTPLKVYVLLCTHFECWKKTSTTSSLCDRGIGWYVFSLSLSLSITPWEAATILFGKCLNCAVWWSCVFLCFWTWLKSWFGFHFFSELIQRKSIFSFPSSNSFVDIIRAPQPPDILDTAFSEGRLFSAKKKMIVTIYSVRVPSSRNDKNEEKWNGTYSYNS